MVTPTVQLLLAAIVPPVKVRLVLAASGLKLGEPQPLMVAPGTLATWSPAGSASVKRTPVSCTLLVLASVKVNCEVLLSATGLGWKVLLMLGGWALPQPVNSTLSMLRSLPEEVALAPKP